MEFPSDSKVLPGALCKELPAGENFFSEPHGGLFPTHLADRKVGVGAVSSNAGFKESKATSYPDAVDSLYALPTATRPCTGMHSTEVPFWSKASQVFGPLTNKGGTVAIVLHRGVNAGTGKVLRGELSLVLVDTGSRRIQAMPGLYEQWNKGIAQRHGRKRGWLKHHWFVVLDRFGVYREYTSIQWDRVTRLVFVCSGNICRSPYSEARARSLGLPASSCGLDSPGDTPAHETAIEIARRRGLDLSRFHSTAFQADRIKSGDLLLAMEPYQAKRLKGLLGSGPQITLLGLWHPQSRPFIQDPYSACREYFEACFIILDESVRRIADQFTAVHGQSTQSSSLAE